MSGRPIIYWDSCAFLALLKGEAVHGPDAAAALRSQAGAFDRGEIVLATSTVAIGEVIAANLGDAVEEAFELMIRRRNFQPFTVTESIARDAARLRSHCYKRLKASSPGEPYLLTMPDAIHVATAMRAGADVLVTLDTDNKTVKTNRRELGMTQVSKCYPVPDLRSVRIEAPALGLPGTDLIG
ncbi:MULTISPECIES: PIN domain-containing protein [Stenotrophomonas]|uniref:type II toxin-antitoxin system VapC family toxin n=1 Tax=Stenotrophomonas TaxID=40323 RepID=UPI0008729797|nr:PIN domain-containing protein [Stenotrophomonas sp. BIIR7]OEZ01244.1 hypothetical protein BIY45_07360 [Stenotrophomonas sp. BIIR7]